VSRSRQIVALGDVLREDRKRIVVESGRQYPIAGVLIAGRGLFWRETIDGAATKYDTLYRLRAGQLVYRKLTAWEGPITVVPEEFDGAYVSAEFPTFTLDESRLLPAFLRCICQQPSFHDEMRMRSTGTAERRNRLAPDALLDIEVELPPLAEQRAITDLARTSNRTNDGSPAQHVPRKSFW
jgi:type I restriction enzyme, S subunit